jgi:hypothetical protein
MVAAHIDDLQAAAAHGMKTVYVRRRTEDIDIIKQEDGTEAVLRDTVKTKRNGGEVDVIVDSLSELARIAYAF